MLSTSLVRADGSSTTLTCQAQETHHLLLPYIKEVKEALFSIPPACPLGKETL